MQPPVGVCNANVELQELWTYLQAQLLYHSIYGLINILLDSCIMLIPNKLFVLNDLRSVVQDMG